MSCRAHSAEPLYTPPPADSIEGQFGYLFGDKDRYLRCTGCGKIGWRIRSRRGAIRWTVDATGYHAREAAKWAAWLAQRAARTDG